MTTKRLNSFTDDYLKRALRFTRILTFSPSKKKISFIKIYLKSLVLVFFLIGILLLMRSLNEPKNLEIKKSIKVQMKP